MPDPIPPPADQPAPAQAPSAPVLLKVLGPLIAGFMGPGGSMRRFVFGLAGVVLLAINKKAGLELDTSAQTIIAGLIATIVIGSNAKEAVAAHAAAKVQVANADATAAIRVAEAGADAPAEEPAS